MRAGLLVLGWAARGSTFPPRTVVARGAAHTVSRARRVRRERAPALREHLLCCTRRSGGLEHPQKTASIRGLKLGGTLLYNGYLTAL